MDKYPMKWYKFIIYIQLFLSAIASLVSAAAYFIGGYYSGLADQVYASYKGLKALDICMAIVCLALAIFAILVRQGLAHFKTKAPIKYLIFLGLTIASQAIYYIAVTLIINASAANASVSLQTNSSLIMSIIINIIMILINKIYFDKRAELFVN